MPPRSPAVRPYRLAVVALAAGSVLSLAACGGGPARQKVVVVDPGGPGGFGASAPTTAPAPPAAAPVADTGPTFPASPRTSTPTLPTVLGAPASTPVTAPPAGVVQRTDDLNSDLSQLDGDLSGATQDLGAGPTQATTDPRG